MRLQRRRRFGIVLAATARAADGGSARACKRGHSEKLTGSDMLTDYGGARACLGALGASLHARVDPPHAAVLAHAQQAATRLHNAVNAAHSCHHIKTCTLYIIHILASPHIHTRTNRLRDGRTAPAASDISRTQNSRREPRSAASCKAQDVMAPEVTACQRRPIATPANPSRLMRRSLQKPAAHSPPRREGGRHW